MVKLFFWNLTSVFFFCLGLLFLFFSASREGMEEAHPSLLSPTGVFLLPALESADRPSRSKCWVKLEDEEFGALVTNFVLQTIPGSVAIFFWVVPSQAYLGMLRS